MRAHELGKGAEERERIKDFPAVVGLDLRTLKL